MALLCIIPFPEEAVKKNETRKQQEEATRKNNEKPVPALTGPGFADGLGKGRGPLPFRHFEGGKGRVEIVVKGLHQAEKLRCLGEEGRAIRQLGVRDGIFQIPALVLQVLGLGVVGVVFSRDLLELCAAHGEMRLKGRRGNDLFPLRAVVEM